MRRRSLSIPAVALAVMAVAAAAAQGAPAPRVAPGWPVDVAAGNLVQGPGGGPALVVVGRDDRVTVSAFRVSGRLRWRSTRVPDCGNCYENPQPVNAWPDGTIGPLGHPSDGWAVDAGGREVRGCDGVVLTGGTCVTTESESPEFVGSGPGGEWRRTVPGWRWAWEGILPMVVADDAEIVYAAFEKPVADSGLGAPGLLVAVDPRTTHVLWTSAGPLEALAGLGSGVLVRTAAGVAAIGGDGVTQWTAAPGPGLSRSLADPVRNRVYLERLTGARPVVTAYDAATGVPVWSTRAGDRARLLSVGNGGRVLLAIGATGRRSVRAVRFTDGAVVWERRTRLPVSDALELTAGLVAVSAGAGAEGRLTVLDPRRR